MAKNKHLTYLERQQIEQLLDQQISIKKIAEYFGKSTSTITREIIKRAVESNKKPLYRITNRCKHRYVCTKHYLCEDKPHCGEYTHKKLGLRRIPSNEIILKPQLLKKADF